MTILALIEALQESEADPNSDVLIMIQDEDGDAVLAIGDFTHEWMGGDRQFTIRPARTLIEMSSIQGFVNAGRKRS